MNIYDDQGKQMGTLNKPDIVLQDGQWWEAAEYRQATIGEYYFDEEYGFGFHGGKLPTKSSQFVMSKIPTPTAEQLRAIGKRCRDDRPVECKAGDTVWVDDGYLSKLTQEDDPQIIGKFRFVLEDAPGEKEDLPCEHCKLNHTPACSTSDEYKRTFPRISFLACIQYITPKPPAPQSEYQRKFGVEGLSPCKDCGKSYWEHFNDACPIKPPAPLDKKSCKACEYLSNRNAPAFISPFEHTCGKYPSASVVHHECKGCFFCQPEPTPKAEVEYEILKNGDILQVGDEFLCPGTINNWQVTNYPSAEVGLVGQTQYKYRRKIKPAFTAEQIERIAHYLKGFILSIDARRMLNDPRDGLNTVINRKEK